MGDSKAVISELPQSFPINSVIDHSSSNESKWYLKIKVALNDDLWLPDISDVACHFISSCLFYRIPLLYIFSYFFTHSFAGEISHCYFILLLFWLGCYNMHNQITVYIKGYFFNYK